MSTLLYAHLSLSSPLIRDHVQLGADASCRNSSARQSSAADGVASSFAVLDAFLPWGGWPIGAMTEIMTDNLGCGELSLLLPAMARLTQEKRPILCIGAPHALFTTGLTQVGIDPAFVTQINPSSTIKHSKENLWSTEQALKTGLPGMVVLWSPCQGHDHCPPEVLRRLHLATIGSRTMLIHFRSASSMSQPSPAWLRFGFAADETHIRLQILKCRGRLLTRPLITLDRIAVQARLYGHLHAVNLLDNAIKNGFTATVSNGATLLNTAPRQAFGVANQINANNQPESHHIAPLATTTPH